MLTFAIPTNIQSKEQEVLLDNLIYSINSQRVQVEHEILVVGNYFHLGETIRSIEAEGTITKLHNVALDNAKYDTIVFLRDYELLWNDWVDGYLYYNSINANWTTMMSPVINKDGTRFRDVCHWDKPGIGGEWKQFEPWCPEGRVTKGGPHLPPYNEFDQRFMYINGGYFIVKREFMKRHRWKEGLDWGQGEDVELSLRMRYDDDFNYVFNPYSIVQLQRQKDRILPVIPFEYFGTFEYIMSKYKR